MKDTVSKGLDLVVSFDTTGSMYPVLSQVRQDVVKFVHRMFKEVPNLRIGIIAHGDYCDKDDPYTIRIMDLTDDEDTICDFIRTTKKTYGGDADECYELVLRNLRTAMSWQAGRDKVCVLIGDASPHSTTYPWNTDHISWVEEARLLNEMDVKIFAVHALSYYRSPSKAFYQRIAEITHGKYLTLDQFNEITDLIQATCIAEYSEEKLNEFVSIIKSNGRMTRTLARNIGVLSNSKIDLGYSEGKAVQKDGLIPVNPGRFQVMTVEENCAIKKFVEDNGITFKKGRGFYELTKHETVQQYKEVIIQDKITGEMFTGAQVRERLGLQPQIDKGGVKESLSSRDTVEFTVFVQSTSYNRKLIAGTRFLYEVDDIESTGTVIDVDSADDGVGEAKVVTAAPKKASKTSKDVKEDKPAKKVTKRSEEGKITKKTKDGKDVKETKPAKKAKTTKTKVNEPLLSDARAALSSLIDSAKASIDAAEKLLSLLSEHKDNIEVLDEVNGKLDYISEKAKDIKI